LTPEYPASRAALEATGTRRALSDPAILSTSSISGIGIFAYAAETVLSVTREARAGVYMTRPTTASRGEYLGLSARDLPVTLWELMPYSFLIDRLVNVKKFLSISRLFCQTEVKFRGGWSIERTTTRRSERALHFDRTASFASPSDTFPRITTDFSFNRVAWNPNLSDVLPPRRGTGLLSSLSSTFDLASVITLRFTR
jgi:hypothetical protein